MRIAVSGGVTFLFSNLLALKQTKPQRVLGYSSIGQMGLLMLALALLRQVGAEASIPLVVGGLFINHLFAKVGLFWLAGYVGKERLQDWAVLARRPSAILTFGILIVAISGLPPFPGFWAKWQLVMTLAVGDLYVWIAIVLVGSLLEAAYMFRWFSLAISSPAEADRVPADLFPIFGMALLLVISGYVAGRQTGERLRAPDDGPLRTQSEITVTAPAPTQVIRLEPGVDWSERGGGD